MRVVASKRNNKLVNRARTMESPPLVVIFVRRNTKRTGLIANY
jgi:hypothetical protein